MNAEILQELEIKSLLIRERYYRDTQQWDKLRNCYHSEPSNTGIKISWFSGDIDGFVEGSKKMAQGAAATSHSITPVEVYLNGDKAVTESIGAIMARFTHQGADLDCVSHSRFISRLVREDAKWKLLSLECIYDKDSIQPAVAGAAIKPLDIDENSRRSYRCLAWVLSKNGFAVDQTLPGTDRPESGHALIASCLDWLNAE